MNQIAFQRAMQEISSRRTNAIAENERRYQEIYEKIPQITEANRSLSQLAIRVLKGEDTDFIKHQGMEAQQYCEQLLEKYKRPKDYLQVHFTCSKCQDTGYDSAGQYCSCLKKLISHYAIAAMNESTQVNLCRFEQFSMDYYKGHESYAKMEKILNFCKNYVQNFQPHSPSLLFWGEPGTGKTHLSLSIVSGVLESGYSVIYDSIANLLSKVEKQHFKNGDSETDMMDLLLGTDLLVMDDLGTEFVSSFTLSALYTIINTRINRNLATIISTNLNEKEIVDEYEPRIASRLITIYDTIHFNGIDIRQRKKEMSEPVI